MRVSLAWLAFWLGLGALAVAACNSAVNDPAQQATAQALETALPLTATQRMTAVPNPYAQLQTAEARATQVGQRAQATLAAQQTAEAFQHDATAQALAPILAALPYYGVNPTREGHPGWLHPPLTLTAKGYHSATYDTRYPQTVMKDGVLSARITWHTRYGSAGCGFVLRANGDEQQPSEYVVLMTRGGWLLFSAIVDGELANLRPIPIRAKDRQFDWHNGATNQLTVVLRGHEITLYTNRALHKTLDVTELPSLYVPLFAPPQGAGVHVRTLQLPAPPSPPPQDASEAWQPYLQAVQSYAARVDQLMGSYVSYLADLIQETPDPDGRAILEDYRSQVIQQQTWFRQSVGALQYYLGHRPDLDFGPGFLSFTAVAESGDATCHFEDAWLWILSP